MKKNRGTAKRPSRRAVPERKRPVSQYFTLRFGGPRAVHAFQECLKALEPCSYRIMQFGEHTYISFDEVFTPSKGKP